MPSVVNRLLRNVFWPKESMAMLLSMGTLIPIEPAGNGIPGGVGGRGFKVRLYAVPRFRTTIFSNGSRPRQIFYHGVHGAHGVIKNPLRGKFRSIAEPGFRAFRGSQIFGFRNRALPDAVPVR